MLPSLSSSFGRGRQRPCGACTPPSPSGEGEVEGVVLVTVTTVLARSAAPRARGAGGRVDDGGRPPSNNRGRAASTSSTRDEVAKSHRGAVARPPVGGGGSCGLRRDDLRNAADAARRSAAGHLVAIMCGRIRKRCGEFDSILASFAKILSTSLGRVLQRPFCFWLTHVEMYQISMILSWSELWPLLQLQTKLRPNHGGQRLWPIPSPGACRRPSPARRCHPHTMGDATYAWFWRNPSGGRVARATTTTSKMPIFESMLNIE